MSLLLISLNAALAAAPLSANHVRNETGEMLHTMELTRTRIENQRAQIKDDPALNVCLSTPLTTLDVLLTSAQQSRQLLDIALKQKNTAMTLTAYQNIEQLHTEAQQLYRQTAACTPKAGARLIDTTLAGPPPDMPEIQPALMEADEITIDSASIQLNFAFY
jgi:hypothetical protein